MAEAGAISRKRLWEMGATAALLFAVAVAVGGFFAWRERQRRLDAELAGIILSTMDLPVSEPPATRDCNLMLSLVRQGASVHVRSATGGTVLIAAASANHVQLLQQASDRGAQINAADKSGFTALIMGAWGGRVEAVQFLLTRGADVNQVERHGYTALSFAYHSRWFDTERHDEVICLLKQHGAKE
jgi:ankyrin repeat protein